MKKVYIILFVIVILILTGGGLIIKQSVEQEKEITTEHELSDAVYIKSLDKNVLQVDLDGQIIYLLNGTSQSRVLEYITSIDDSNQSYYIRNSEGQSKSRPLISDYDRLYVASEDGTRARYYTFRITDSLN